MSPERFAVRGARVLVRGSLERRDILVQAGRIAEVAPEVDRDAQTLDAAGLIALPGAIDAHVHFREPGLTHKEDWASGSRAALAGGVTTVLDMPNTVPPTTSLEALEQKRRLAAGGSLVDFGLFFGLTEQNVEEALAADGVAGVKVFLGASTGGLVVRSEAVLERLFAACRKPIVVHAEEENLMQAARTSLGRPPRPLDHGALRSVEAAVAALQTALELALRHGAHLHVAHVSSAAELDRIVEARKLGARVTCEVAPHHLLLDESYVAAQGCRGKVNPPLRPAGEPERLWERLRRGVVDCVASDHAPHLAAEKDRTYDEAPSGLPSVELFLPLLIECVARGRLGLADVVRLSAEGPAQVFGLRGKGRIERGYDADLALVDLQAGRTVEASAIRSRCGWSPYEGWSLTGWPVVTLVRGRIAFGPQGYDASSRGREVDLGESRGESA
jgi:dihydroorotase